MALVAGDDWGFVHLVASLAVPEIFGHICWRLMDVQAVLAAIVFGRLGDALQVMAIEAGVATHVGVSFQFSAGMDSAQSLPGLSATR